MRLKTLRKERPAFENEGAVINGSRMDLSNSELKPAKYRTNNAFALPTSLNNEVSSLNLCPSDYTPDMNTNHSQPLSTTRRAFLFTTPSQPTHTSSYQAIEAAYLEHGIRIHLNSSAAAVVAQQQILSTENLNSRKSANSIQRHKAFVNRNPSRSSSALNYSTGIQDMHQESRPFSALQQTSTAVDFDQINAHNNSSIEPNENQNPLQSTNNYCSSLILTNEQSDNSGLPIQSTITNGKTSTDNLIDNDPDFAYMSSLLKTTSGDSFRDSIRRRAGLRATFAVHRHPQYSTTINSKQSEKSSVTHTPSLNHQSTLTRTSTIAVAPTIVNPSSKKLEKDILKHASRIRTNHIKDTFLHHQSSLRSQINDYTSSISNSPTRLNPQTKRNKTFKESKTFSLEPLELLLAPPPRPLSLSPARTNSLTLHGRPFTHHHDNHQEYFNYSKKRTQSSKSLSVKNNNGITTSFSLNEQSNSIYLNDDSLSLMKTSPLDLTINDKTRQSNSFDSGCYDRSSSSADTHSITSLSINQASSSVPSARLTSASTRRSNINKKVSFEDQSSTVIITTATYV